MSDLIDRIKGLRYVHVPQASQLFEEAIAEIARLRGDAEIARLRLEAAHAEIARLRNQVEQLRSEVADAKKWAMQERSQRWALPEPLTDAEREVLGHEVELAEYQQRHDLVATLRGLLERLG